MMLVVIPMVTPKKITFKTYRKRKKGIKMVHCKKLTYYKNGGNGGNEE